MTTWVALLRAVNLGPTNKVPMAQLRTALAREGFAEVRTYIASGNVLLASDEPRESLARRLEELIAAEFGVTTPAIMRTADELAAVLAAHPFADSERSYVSFLASEPAPEAVEALHTGDWGDERAAVVGSEAYLSFPAGIGRAQLSGPRLERILGVAGTVRNWRTVTALAELAAG
ncbi:MAG: DUF1697 domain-containing protein [Actinobacteria bacterium]|nr:DUF1697 domain-containing protein [Actinomycetota bacterium]